MLHRFRSALATTVLLGLISLCVAATAPLKVAFVYVGPIADGGGIAGVLVQFRHAVTFPRGKQP